MRALLTSKNLIGDSLCISAALRVWHREHPEYEIDLLTNNDAVAELYKGMGVPLQVIFEPKLPTPELEKVQKQMQEVEQIVAKVNKEHSSNYAVFSLPENLVTQYDFRHNFDVNKAFQVCDQKKCHMAQGYADGLGVKLGSEAADLGPFYDPPQLEEDDEWVARVPEGAIVLAPFSRSCSSHSGGQPNKCLPWAKWKPILRFFRGTGRPVRITGSSDDRADELGFSEEEYLTGMPLRPLARAMKEGRIHMVVSVDNGISHLAGSQKANQILYYPMCLGLHYACPWSNPYVMPIHTDPALAEPAQLLWATKQSYNMLEKMRKEGPDGPLSKRE